MTDKTLEELKAELDAAEAAHFDAYDAHEAARAAEEAARDAHYAARAAYLKALKAQENSDA